MQLNLKKLNLKKHRIFDYVKQFRCDKNCYIKGLVNSKYKFEVFDLSYNLSLYKRQA